MITEDINNLFINLMGRQGLTAEKIAKSFGKERKYTYRMEYSNSFTVNQEFIAGLKEYGYELRLYKLKGDNKCQKEN